jgi:hypothetical protein
VQRSEPLEGGRVLTSLEPISGSIINIPIGTMTATNLTLPEDTTPEEFVAVGVALSGIKDAAQWGIGAWLAHGENFMGENFSQYAEVLGISEVSKLQYIRIHLRIAPERRRAELSWSHHRAVAPLDPEDQSRFLQMAIDQNWSKGELEDAIRTELRGTLPPPPGNRRYVVEAVAEAAEKVYDSAVPSLADPGTYVVPEGPMQDLGNALGAAQE